MPYQPETYLDFSKISLDDLVALSKKGKLGPHEGEEIELLITHKKPLWLVSQSTTNFKKIETPNEVKEFLYSNPEFKIQNFVQRTGIWHWISHLIFHPDNEEYYHKFKNAEKLNSNNIAYHIEQGRALGYTEADMAKYITRNYSIDHFTVWQNHPNWGSDDNFTVHFPK